MDSEMGRTGTVYVVDDDDAVRESLSALLVSAGIETQSFATASDILDCVLTLDHGCILLDVCLPDVNGIEVLARLREAGSSVPVILMSGHEHLCRRARRNELDAIAILEKPISDDVLLATVDAAFKRQ